MLRQLEEVFKRGSAIPIEIVIIATRRLVCHVIEPETEVCDRISAIYLASGQNRNWFNKPLSRGPDKAT